MTDFMKANAKLAGVLCFAVLGTAMGARADCRHVRGGITETIIAAPNDPLGRVLGNVDGVLNGAHTALITSFNPAPAPLIVLHATSFDVFVTNGGDMLTGTCANTLTPVPGKPPGDFRENATFTITGGSGKYAGATGRMSYKGRAHNVFGGAGLGTFNLIYRGYVCGPNVEADRDSDGDSNAQ